MTFERYTDWLSRGRAHQVQGRVIDAFLCYRRALREFQGGADAQFHLGEIAWHLGNVADAIAAWQAATSIDDRHLPSWQALADAFATVGRFDESLAAAGHVLALRPGEPRTSALIVMLRAAMLGDVDDATANDVLTDNLRWPLRLLSSVTMRLLANADGRPFPHALAALLERALDADVAIGNEDGLREIALALANAGDASRAAALAERYATICRALHRSSVPLLWPRRTAGLAVRVGVIATHEALPLAKRLMAASLAGAQRDACRWWWLAPPGSAVVEPAASEARPASVERDSYSTLALSSDGTAAARAVATLDLDVIIDAAGVRAPIGPLLARRPARSIWAVEYAGIPALGGLTDRVFAAEGATAGGLTIALADEGARVASEPVSLRSAGDLMTQWDAAVHAHRAGNHLTAAAGYASVLADQPDYAPGHYLSGVLTRSNGDVQAARAHLRAAVQAAPAFGDARVALADLETGAGNIDEATAIVREGLALSPSAALLRALGQAELKRANASEAAAAFAEALKLDPGHGETHYNHGVALQMARDQAGAARAYQRALAFRPDLVAADFNLGVIFDRQGNTDAAIAAFTTVLDRTPGHVPAYKALAETYLAAGRIDAWLANFDRFERHCPHHIAVAAQALEVCAYRADFARLAAYLDGLRDGRFSDGAPDEVLDALQLLLYLLHFFDVEPELIGRHARTHDAIARTMYGEPWPRSGPRRPGKLRIGYLSGDFRNHVMGKMMWEALRHHDRGRFEVYGYSTSDASDEWTERYRAIFERLDSLEPLSDRQAAQRIAGDDLDVLVDLSTHTKGSRPGIVARKPARVQITHVASAGTLAMSAIDFKLTDRYADAGYDATVQIEAPLVMDGCVFPYRHVAPAIAPIFTREQFVIAAHAVVIGAFCTPLKLSQRCLALWRDVLQRVPDALLAFSPVQPALRTVFLRIAAAAGIDTARVVFIPQGRDDAENRARYRLIDFVLDPLPYGGVNGTLEALDMGVPVVTLVGRRHAERTSYSILSNLGVTSTIAATGVEYVDIATRLASDAGFMQEVRCRIAAALVRSTLTDMPAHTRNLERAYIEALARNAPDALADAGSLAERIG